MKVQDVMTISVVSVGEDTPVKHVAEALLAHSVSGVPVVSEGGTLLGIVTEADLLAEGAECVADTGGNLALADQAEWMTARDVMTVGVQTAHPHEDIGSVARRMLEARVKRMPVVSEGRLVGIVSRHDLLHAFGDEDALLMQRLERLLERYFYFPADHQIDIAVVHGAVTLKGIVHYERDARVIGALIEGAEGVARVTNRIRFLEPGYPEAHIGRVEGRLSHHGSPVAASIEAGKADDS